MFYTALSVFVAAVDGLLIRYTIVSDKIEAKRRGTHSYFAYDELVHFLW